MATPNKLSLKKKSKRGPTEPVGDCIVITDSDDEKENNDKLGVTGSFRTKYRTPRRESTILAGNLTMLDQSTAMVEPEEQQTNVTIRRSKGKVGRGSKRDSTALTPLHARPPLPRLSLASVMTEDLTIPHTQAASHKPCSGAEGLVTEDESDFYSCQGSPPNPMNVGMQNTWMTDITTNSERERRKAVKVPLVRSTPSQDTATPQGVSIFKKPQGSIVKAAAFFSVEKRLAGAGAGLLGGQNVLVGGSDSDDSPQQAMVPARLQFTGQLERTVVASSDDQVTEDDTPAVRGGGVVSDSDDDVPLVQLGRDFLSDTQFGKIVNWVQHSPFTSKLEKSVSKASPDTSNSHRESDDSVSSLLRSDPEEGDVRPSWAAPLPSNTITQCSEGTSKAGGSWNRSGTTRSGTTGMGSQGTSKAGGSWNLTGSEVQGSEGTSKAGGSWSHITHLTADTARTSKAGLDSGRSCDGARTKNVGRNNSQVVKTGDSARTSKAGGSARSGNAGKDGGSTKTSKAGGDGGSTKTSKAGGDGGSTKTSKAGGGSGRVNTQESKNLSSKNNCNDLDSTFDKLRLSDAKVLKGGSKLNKKGRINSVSASNPSKNTSNCAGTKTNPEQDTKSATESSLHLRLSLSQSDGAVFTNQSKSLNLDGANPPSQSRSSSSNPSPPASAPPVPGDGSILQASYVKGPRPMNTPKLPPIENSMNAVRSWSQVTESQQLRINSSEVRGVWGQISVGTHSQVSEGVEKCNVKGKAKVDSDSDEEDLEKFLVNLKSKKKPSKLISSDESDDKFVVPDDEVDSDQFATPKLSLKERIERKSKPKPKPDISSHRKARLPSPVPGTDSDSLPDIDSKGSSTTDEEQRNTKKKNPPKTRPGRSVKKAQVIYSDSEDEEDETPVHTISSDDDGDQSFVNIYEPGSYHLVPAPSTPIVIPPTQKKVKVKTKTAKVPAGLANKTPKHKQAQQDNVCTPTTTLTFLSSLTMDTPIARCHPAALPYLKNFPKQKVELASRLYTLYNTECFGGALPEEMEITWNVRLTKTAGLCYSRRHRNRHNIEVRSSRIELSTKVLDSGDRLRDTLIHEMCHAASWIISGYRDGHGPLWRTWAEKAMERFPELPVIDRCHSYQIRTKYTYRCEKCGYSIGRHSKSLDTERKVCGHCYGRFQLVVNGKSVQAKVTDSAVTNSKPKAPNAFALFVKDNYKLHKQPGVSHGDVMKLLSTKFSETKISK